MPRSKHSFQTGLALSLALGFSALPSVAQTAETANIDSHHAVLVIKNPSENKKIPDGLGGTMYSLPHISYSNIAVKVEMGPFSAYLNGGDGPFIAQRRSTSPTLTREQFTQTLRNLCSPVNKLDVTVDPEVKDLADEMDRLCIGSFGRNATAHPAAKSAGLTP
ncbi:MAG: hypothetical protein WAO98_00145 [Alphaproteobacteria bacterium]